MYAHNDRVVELLDKAAKELLSYAYLLRKHGQYKESGMVSDFAVELLKEAETKGVGHGKYYVGSGDTGQSSGMCDLVNRRS